MEVCLIHIEGNRYKLVDCQTGEEIDLKAKKKRAPSKYNLFMKECIKSKDGPIQERFKTCAFEYKKQKR